jgi:hypothetical protein
MLEDFPAPIAREREPSSWVPLRCRNVNIEVCVKGLPVGAVVGPNRPRTRAASYQVTKICI